MKVTILDVDLASLDIMNVTVGNSLGNSRYYDLAILNIMKVTVLILVSRIDTRINTVTY